MPISVTCQCGQAFRAKDDLAGKKVKCPKCGQPLTIPNLEPGESLSALDELLPLDTLPGPGSSAQQSSSGLPTEFPQAGGGFMPPGAGGGFQPAGLTFGQPGAKSKSSGLNKTLIISLGGVLLLAVVAVLLIVLLRDGDSGPTSVARQDVASLPSSTSPQPTPTTPPATQQKALALAALNAVTLDPGGRASVELKVERNGAEGPIQIQLEGAPPGISAQASEIPAGQSAGKLELSANDKLGEAELKASLKVTIKVGTTQATQPLAITVKKMSLPSFEPVGNIVLQPGATAAINLTVQRNGYTGPLDLRVEGLPVKLAGKVENIPAGQNQAKLEITVAPDAPDAAHKIRAVATASGRTINVEIPLQIDKLPFRFNSLMVVTLKPGESKSVQVPVERRSYQGPIRLKLDNLPQGVTMPEMEIAPAQLPITLAFTAANDAKERVRSAKLVGTAGHLQRVDYIVVRVSKGEGGFLPNEVVADPEVSKVLRRGGFGGRMTHESKAALMDAYGGTPESEQAVLRGLRWLATHQQSDGRWSLKDYSKNIPNCNCKSPAEKEVLDNDTAGTAFGVLPFLGVGIAPNRAPEYPPDLAKFQRVVREAINVLVRNQDQKTGNLGGKEQTMYAHALGTMALAEAYGLSGDEKLKVPAQKAIKYLIDGQDPKGGGWRYGPKQPGDMSVTSWMFLAIRYGQLAGLAVRSEPLTKAERFVESCTAGPEGAKRSRYSYEPGKDATLSMTAAGLLTRQYLGWKRDRADLAAGCKYLMEHQPPDAGGQLGPLYYYYYATQVLHHMEGPEFDLWNHRMREHLIRTQQRSGHQDGSWAPEGCDWATRGGRLYATSLALMSLEVYYRHLPMYQQVGKIKEVKETKE